MSTTATSAPASPPRNAPRGAWPPLRHLECLRWLAVGAAGALAAAPPAAALARGAAWAGAAAALGLFYLVFAYNDLCDARLDAANPRRRALTPADREGLRATAWLGAAAAVAAGAFLPWRASAALWAAAACGVLYCHPATYLKGRAAWSQLSHAAAALLVCAAGALALGATPGAAGRLAGLFFALVAAATSLAGELQDHDSDRAHGLRTTAIRLGRGRAHALTGLCHAAALALLPACAPDAPLWPLAAAAAAAYAAAHVEARRDGLDAAALAAFRRSYRVVFGTLAAALLAAWALAAR